MERYLRAIVNNRAAGGADLERVLNCLREENANRPVSPPQHIEPVAKRWGLDFQRSSRLEQSNQPAPDQFAELDHPAEVSPEALLVASRIS